jgi:acyl-CoA-binding protein
MATLLQQFQQAQKDVQALTERPDNDALLELYSYYKQATEGDIAGDRPGPFDFKARAKYDAWADRKGMSKDVAMKGYVKLVQHLKSQT